MEVRGGRGDDVSFPYLPYSLDQFTYGSTLKFIKNEDVAVANKLGILNSTMAAGVG